MSEENYPCIGLCLFHFHDLGIEKNKRLLSVETINHPYLCDYCRVIGLKPHMSAQVMVTVYEVEPVWQAVKFHAAESDSEYAHKEQEKTIRKLQKKCEILENHIRFQPGGEGALEALQHWEELNNESRGPN